MFKITIITLIIALLIWFGIAALLTYLASLAIGFSMSLVKVLFVFVAGIVIKGCLPSKE